MVEDLLTYEQLQAELAETQRLLAEATENIASLKQEEEARESARRRSIWVNEHILKSIMDNIPEGVTVADRRTETIIMESRYGLYLEGRPGEQRVVPLREGLQAMRMAHVDTLEPARPEELPLWRATMNGETIKGEEWALVPVNHEPLTLLINAGPIIDPLGKITGGVAAWQDITDRKQLELQLKARETQLRLMFEVNPAPIMLVEADSLNILKVNGAFTEMMGYTGDECSKIPVSALWQRQDRYEQWKSKILRDRECHGYEAELKTRDGELRTLVLSSREFELSGQRSLIIAMHDLTDRKMAEEALLENASLLTNILETLPVGVFIMNKEGYVTYANSAGRRIWGGIKLVSLDELALYRATWFETGEPVTADQWAAARAIREGKTTLRDKVLIEAFDGKKRFILNSGLPIYDQKHELKGAVAVVEDITFRYEAEIALRRSEQQYRELVETAAVLILRIDLDCNVVFFNEHVKKVYGYDESVLGRSAVELFNIPGDRVPEELKKTVLVDSSVYLESQSTVRDGRTVWVGWSLRLIREADGAPKEVLAVGLDITERKKGEEVIRESEARFRTLADTLPNLVWTMTPEGRVEYVNKRWEDYMGMTFAESEHWFQRVHPDDRKHTLDVWNHALVTGDFYQVQYRLRGVDGTYRWHLNLATPVRDLNGKIFRWFGTSTDIHNQKQAEQDLRRIAAELERSNRELEEFAYVASHDLQEPLRMVTGYLQLLERRYKDKMGPEADEFIGYAVDGATRMQRLITDLLAYSRVGTRGGVLVPTDLNVAFERAQADLRSSIQETGTTLTHDPLPVVRGDETQLTQLFQNLIGNAIKFRSEQPPEIHVGVERRGDGYLISVKDNGIGIDPRYSARIFQLFQRLHTRQKYSGTGIGLAICKKILDRHGGRIWVESELGHGATFYFTLPAGETSWT